MHALVCVCVRVCVRVCVCIVCVMTVCLCLCAVFISELLGGKISTPENSQIPP